MSFNPCPFCGATAGVVFDRDGQLEKCNKCIRIAIERGLDEAEDKIASIAALVGLLDERRGHPGVDGRFLHLLGAASELNDLWRVGVTKSLAVSRSLKQGYGLVELIEIDREYGIDEVRKGPDGEIPSSARHDGTVPGGIDDLLEDPEFGPHGLGI